MSYGALSQMTAIEQQRFSALMGLFQRTFSPFTKPYREMADGDLQA